MGLDPVKRACRPQECWSTPSAVVSKSWRTILQTPASGSVDPAYGSTDPRHAVLQTRSPGSAARRAGLALALRACNASAGCLQPGAQPHPLQPLELSVAGHGNSSAKCLQPRACCPTKICIDCFLPNHPFNAKCIPMKRQPTLPL
jgi:hypothetical protein